MDGQDGLGEDEQGIVEGGLPSLGGQVRHGGPTRGDALLSSVDMTSFVLRTVYRSFGDVRPTSAIIALIQTGVEIEPGRRGDTEEGCA
ncbi:hypothetical protein ABH940_003249 [Streptacidiphilus sp. BW17]|uniref:hypothetical protein n=1 Tax=unclassified Streptacidiphilus TaxID=2643834 RepID=UPI003511CA46